MRIESEAAKTLLNKSFTRHGLIYQNREFVESHCITLDTGANAGNYIGSSVLLRSNFDWTKIKKCNHVVRLGDGTTNVHVKEKITLDVALYDSKDKIHKFVGLDFFVIDTLGHGVIIGMESIMTKMFDLFMDILVGAKSKIEANFLKLVTEDDWSEEFHEPDKHAILEPWTQPVLAAPEEAEVPEALLFPEETLKFMELPPEEACKEYLDSLLSHISPEMLKAAPGIVELLQSPLAQKVFAPKEWKGLNVKPIDLKLKEGHPRIQSRSRPVRKDLYENAYKECIRLCKYFLVKASESSITSPLTIAPKATPPYLRFCGDYRLINMWLEVPPRPIPNPIHELTRALKWKVFVDLDMTNAFHQLPLSPETSALLTINTPWGLFSPQFLPEGVAPASGILQEVVRSIFEDFSDWIIVVYDNFLICAESHEDAKEKLEKVLKRCADFNLILKFKKSWIGYDEANFFGYRIGHGTWELTEERKETVAKIPFPKNRKEMQSFLGSALFFHNHILDYAAWSTTLYEMTREDFNWDSSTWKTDYFAYFSKFKDSILSAMKLHVPDYSLPWYIRTDASNYAMGAVLYQVATNSAGEQVNQPIQFASKMFSPQATASWDAHKKEGFALFAAVKQFSYLIHGKAITILTDHRNLQWMEKNDSPIVTRWRAYIQNFQIAILHIRGADNKLADYLSRIPEAEAKLLQFVESPSFGSIMNAVHGGRSMHFGAYTTWKRAKELFPDADIPLEAVRTWVRECPACQKLFGDHIHGLPQKTLSLKNLDPRRVVGIDHVSISPTDKFGNTCAIVVVEHFSHFVQVYPCKSYDADTAARVLFKHWCTFGVFTEVAMDPGSTNLSKIVEQLNAWVGIAHKISLIGRHESNGCEGSIRQIIRHLTMLVSDERIVDRWSDDTVLPLIIFAINSFPSRETGGLTPFMLKYGSVDAAHLTLPEDSPAEAAHALLKALDKNLKVVREVSAKFQQEIAAQRRAKDQPFSAYSKGDLILWNPKEHPHHMVGPKLSPKRLGPFEVLKQVNNDITCEHVVSKKIFTLHTSRVVPFVGSPEAAFDLAKLDDNQFVVKKINFIKGNPLKRTSLAISVEFEQSITSEVQFDINDIGANSVFKDFVSKRPWFSSLLVTETAFKKLRSQANKKLIQNLEIGKSAYLHLRYYDFDIFSNYEQVNWPDLGAEYCVEVKVLKVISKNSNSVKLHCPLLKDTPILNNFGVETFIISPEMFNFLNIQIVDKTFLESLDEASQRAFESFHSEK